MKIIQSNLANSKLVNSKISQFKKGQTISQISGFFGITSAIEIEIRD